jgi:predicted acyl esterase
VARLRDNPFDDPKAYGPDGSILLGADFDKITIPFLTAVSQTAILHGRAGFEAFLEAKSSDKALFVVDSNYPAFLYRECLSDEFAFFDRHLKGLDAAKIPPVQIVIRLGDNEYEWRTEETWPIPETTLLRLHLDATSLGVSEHAPPDSGMARYLAEADAGVGESGVSFISAALPEDLEIVGHVTARLWFSSSAPDADVYVTVRVIDANGSEVYYVVRDRTYRGGISWGSLKVSQRAIDPTRGRYRPWHTHRAEDQMYLRGPDEIVALDVELLPTAVRVAAGHRLRIDVQPVEGPGAAYRDFDGTVRSRYIDPAYHVGAENRIYTGPGHPSCIELPIVPRVAAYQRPT